MCLRKWRRDESKVYLKLRVFIVYSHLNGDRHLGWLYKIPNINLSSKGKGTSISKNSKDRGVWISKC